MRRIRSFMGIALVAGSFSALPVAAGVIGTCEDGIRTSTDFRLVVTGSTDDPLPTYVCGPSQQDHTLVSGGMAAIGVGSVNGGASAGAGALAAEPFKSAQASARASIEFEFMLKTVVPGTPFGFLQIGYEAQLTTLDFNVGVTSPSSATISGRGFVNVFELLDTGVRIAAGGVPLDHRNGVSAPLSVGQSLFMNADSVSIKPDTPYSIELSVISSAIANAGSLGTAGSASAEFSAAIALANLFVKPFSESDRYEIVLAIADDPGVVQPGAGVFPAIDSPLGQLVPPVDGDTDMDGDVDNTDLGTAIQNFTGPGGVDKVMADGDTDGDGDVDNTDLGAAIANFTGPSPTPAPEPASLVMWVGLVGAVHRRSRCRG